MPTLCIGYHRRVRKLLSLIPLALLVAACDPTIRKFEVVPDKLQCAGIVTLKWEGDADGGQLKADQPVTPALPDSVLASGEREALVTQTTTFTFFYPSAAQREKTVTVANKNCGGGPGPGDPCPKPTLTLTGTCTSPAEGPSYITVSLSAAEAPGMLQQITTDADFPVHVLHAGEQIALSPGNGPIFPLPAVPAAGDYTIIVPGDVGPKICAESGPTSGSTEAPVVHLMITPACPQK